MVKPALFPILSRSSWLLFILVSTIGFVVSLRQKRHLKVPPVYLCYCASASTIQFIFWLSAANFKFLYLFFEVTNSVLLFSATFELFQSVIAKKGLRVAIPCSLVVAYAIIHLLSTGTTPGSLEGNLRTLLMVLMLFASLSLGPKQWTRESRLVFTGILLLAILSFASSFLLKSLLTTDQEGREVIQQGPEVMLKGAILFSQLSPLPGLIFLILAGQKKDPETNSNPEINIDLTLGEEGPKFENKLNKNL